MNFYLNINDIAFLHPFLDLFDCIGRAAVKYFKMRNAVF